MRKHPLLALFTAAATVALSTSGVLDQSASASQPPSRNHNHSHGARRQQRERGELKELATDKAPRAHQTASATRLSGAISLTFAITDGPVLGSYVPPALRRERLEAHRRRAEALHRARLAALRRARLAARRRASTAPAGGVWAELRTCESGGNYAEDTGNGFYGAYQFLPSTWWSLGFSGLPNEAPPAVQDRAARMLLVRQGWGAWPVCSRLLGL